MDLKVNLQKFQFRTCINWLKTLFRYVDVFVTTHQEITEKEIDCYGLWFCSLTFVRHALSHCILNNNEEYLIIIATNIRLVILLLGIDLQKTKAYKEITGQNLHYYDSKKMLKQRKEELGRKLTEDERNNAKMMPLKLTPGE